MQFDTIRKLRSTDAKVYESSPSRVGEGLSFAKGTVRVRSTSCPSQSEWMQDVLWGIECMMGYDIEADHVVPIDMLVAVLDYIKKECSDKLKANELWKIGAFICLVMSASSWATGVSTLTWLA